MTRITLLFALSLAVGCAGTQDCDNCTSGSASDLSCETCPGDTGDPADEFGTVEATYSFEGQSLVCDILENGTPVGQTGSTFSLKAGNHTLAIGPSEGDTTSDGLPVHVIEDGEWAGWPVVSPEIGVDVIAEMNTSIAQTANAYAAEVEWTCYITSYVTEKVTYEDGDTLKLPGITPIEVSGMSGEFLDPENDSIYSIDFEYPDYIFGNASIGSSLSRDFRCWIGSEEDDPEPELTE